ncbi:MAG TPA: hypothetical protein VG125_33855 [Pirellulales bacterium]|jgi:hypothetical protein|nr:hypothetical protein [Pirellulales bacterium]
MSLGELEHFAANLGAMPGGQVTKPQLIAFARKVDEAISRCTRVEPGGHLVDQWNRPDRKPDSPVNPDK